MLFSLLLVVFAQCPTDATIGCTTQPEGSTCETQNKCPQYTEGHSEGRTWRYKCIANKWEPQTCNQMAPKNFKYPTSDIEMLKDKPMTPITPTIECYQCIFKVKEISHNVPAVFPTGINFQEADGTISGTPTEEKEKTEYTIIARANDAAAQLDFKITMMVATETANYTLVIIVVICVVVLVGLFGLCLFFRFKGTGRAGARKSKTLKSTGKQTTSNRV